jgi:hypothetical protein
MYVKLGTLAVSLAAILASAAAVTIVALQGAAQRGGSSAAGPTTVRYPTTDIGVSSLGARAKAQRDTASQFKVFYQFQFRDTVTESGINFFNYVVDDAARFHKPVHYDHGTGIAAADVDGDGLEDLYFVNQLTGSQLWKNVGGGRFRNLNSVAGVALADRVGVTASFADTDNDGDQDLFVTTVRGGNVLFENDGRGRFKDISKAAGVDHVGHSSGAVFFDYDNDGLLDMIAVNGHVYPQLDKARLRASAGYRQRKLLYRNRGDTTFDEVGPAVGPAIMEERVSRGLAVGDLDDDGRLDVVINDLDGSPQILRNEIVGAGSWLLVRLKGKGVNTGAVGAVVKARVGTIVQQRLVQSGSSYISQEDKRLHFGIGKAAQVDAIEVLWPDGTTSRMADVKANQIVEVRQQ